MKAPDKIYLVQNTSGTNFIWDVEKWDNHRNFEYISKDALLEWANKFSHTHLPGSTVIAYLIDKMNTL